MIDSTYYIVNYIILEMFYTLQFAPPKEAAFVKSIIFTGVIVQCMLYFCYFCNKARTLLTAWGRVSCYATDSVSLMDCFTSLVNLCGVALRLNGVDKPSTPKRESFREERCEHYGVNVAITCLPHDGVELREAMSNE